MTTVTKYFRDEGVNVRGDQQGLDSHDPAHLAQARLPARPARGSYEDGAGAGRGDLWGFGGVMKLF